MFVDSTSNSDFFPLLIMISRKILVVLNFTLVALTLVPVKAVV